MQRQAASHCGGEARTDACGRLPLHARWWQWLRFGSVFLLGIWCIACRAQASGPRSQASAAGQQEGQSPYEGQKVVSIELAGQPEFNLSRCGQCIVQQVGEPFSEKKVNASGAALKAAGGFERVETQVEPVEGGLRIVFVLEPATSFGIFRFPGASRFPYSQLIQAANFPSQGAFNPSEVERDRGSLTSFFEREGYFKATVAPKIDVDSTHAIANVDFGSALGQRAKFGSIEVQGTEQDQARRLEHKLTTLSARVHGAAIRPGKTYHHSILNRATTYAQTTLAKQGYLGAQVQLSGAEYIAATNRADIHLNVKSGPVTHVRIEGAHLWPWTRKSLLPVYQGIGVDAESVDEGRRALISYFESKGYFDVKVESQLSKQPSGATIVYRVRRDSKHKVTAARVSGNKALPSSSLTSKITVQRGGILSPGKFSDQLVQASIDNLKAVYRSEGFGEAKIDATVDRAGKNVQVEFHVTEGPREIVNSLTVRGADTFQQSQFAPSGLRLAAGQPYSQAHVQADRAEILSNYLKAGYLTASFRETASHQSKAADRVDVIYRIHEGPKVSAGEVLTLGREHTRQRLIDGDTQGIRSGQPLTETELLVAGSRLYDHTGVFDWAEIDPKERVTTQTTDDVLVKVHESKRNDFTYGFGFEVIERGGSIPSGTVAIPNLPPVGLPSNFTTSEQTFYGPRGTFQYTRNNLFGRGESLSLTGFAGRLDQRGAVYYIDPNFRWSSWKATTSFSFERDEENPIFSSQATQGTLQFQRALETSKKNTFFAQYAFSKVDLTRLLIPSLVPEQDRHITLSTVSGNITRDTRDNPLDEHKGVLDTLEVDFNTTKLGSSVDFAKLTAQAAWYGEHFHHVVWAESIRIGLAQPFAGSFVPLSEQFFTGGGNSLRGFPLDGAGPQRTVPVCSSGSSTNCIPIQVPTGGNELLILNSEARIPLPVKKNLSLAVFYDGGNVFPSVGFKDFATSNRSATGLGYSNNVGLGLRYSTPVGPIRIDIGRNLNPVKGVNATPYFIGIGQAF